MICEAALCDDFDLVEAAVLRELDRVCKGAGDGIRRMAVTVDHDLTAAGADLLQNPRRRIGGRAPAARDCTGIFQTRQRSVNLIQKALIAFFDRRGS